MMVFSHGQIRPFKISVDNSLLGVEPQPRPKGKYISSLGNFLEYTWMSKFPICLLLNGLYGFLNTFSKHAGGGIFTKQAQHTVQHEKACIKIMDELN